MRAASTQGASLQVAQPAQRGPGQNDHCEDGQVFQAVGVRVFQTPDQGRVVGGLVAAGPVVDRCAAQEAQAPVQEHGEDEQQGPGGKTEQGLNGGHGLLRWAMENVVCVAAVCTAQA